VASSRIQRAIAAIPFLLLGISTQPVASTPTCFGRSPTILGTEERDVLRGTPAHDVIAGFGGHDLSKVTAVQTAFAAALARISSAGAAATTGWTGVRVETSYIEGIREIR
jgi:hypothetical protein